MNTLWIFIIISHPNNRDVISSCDICTFILYKAWLQYYSFFSYCFVWSHQNFATKLLLFVLYSRKMVESIEVNFSVSILHKMNISVTNEWYIHNSQVFLWSHTKSWADYTGAWINVFHIWVTDSAHVAKYVARIRCVCTLHRYVITEQYLGTYTIAV